jgi:SpoVK/Ycf46/Vps4 family AAA+-type ATPase
VVAAELGLDLYRIDLSGVVSKYIGETEKNLEKIFVAAAATDAVLFFDEADALFGKRSETRDAHDRYANIETAYLLQRLEDHEGVAILASNLPGNLDDAFTRRLAFRVHFPFPDEVARRRLWAGVWPAEAPMGSDVDLDRLAADYQLSGGNIRNVALAAAFRAADGGREIDAGDVARAVAGELRKLGQAVRPSRGDAP